MWPRWPTLKVARVLAAPIDKAHPLLKPPSESWPRSSRLATTQELALLSEDGRLKLDMARSPHLALELRYLILGNLVGATEKSTLRSLSLVSRDWRTATLKLLFRKLVVSVDPAGHSIQALLCTLHRSPVLASCISTLELHGHDFEKCFQPKGPQLTSISVAILITLVPQLPNIRALTLCGFMFTANNRDISYNGAYFRPYYDLDLTLAHCTIDMPVFIQLFNGVGRPAKFCLASTTVFPSYTFDTSESTKSESRILKLDVPQELTTLDIGFTPRQGLSYCTDIDTALLRGFLSKSNTRINSFGMGLDLDNTVQKTLFFGFLERSGQQIRQLRWDLRPVTCEQRDKVDVLALLANSHGRYGYGAIPAEWPTDSLGRMCRSLESLTLGLFSATTTNSHPDAIMQWRYALHVLAGESRKTLKHIRFALERPLDVPRRVKGAKMALVPWHKLDWIFAGMADLKAVEFVEVKGNCFKSKYVVLGRDEGKANGLVPEQGLADFQKFLRNKLPAIHRRGLVRFL